MPPVPNGASTVPAPLPLSAQPPISIVPRAGQKTVTLSAAQYGEIEQLVAENASLYESVSQFVKHAVTEQILKTRPGRRQ